MTIQPEDIIAAFDAALDYIYGRSRGRDYPAKSDLEYAAAWLQEGLTLHVACFVFYHRMSGMHELWLRQKDHRDDKHIPATLKFFDESIRSGIARHKAGGEPIASWEQSESQWIARIKGWIDNGRWLTDAWGSRPFEEGCRAPQRLIDKVTKEKKDRII